MSRGSKDVALLRELAEFRYQLRQFLHFSEEAAARRDLPAQQHQLLLQIAGAAEGVETTVSYVAERLGLRHHSVVELSKRCEDAGLVERRHEVADRRFVVLRVTAEGQRVLRALSEDHARELHDLAPRLMEVLTRIGDLRAKAADAGTREMRGSDR